MPHKFTRIPIEKRSQLLKCFAADLTATQTALLTGLNRNTVNDWYMTIRRHLRHYLENNDEIIRNTNRSREFLAFTTQRLAKFRGLSRADLQLHGLESVFRFKYKKTLEMKIMEIMDGSSIW